MAQQPHHVFRARAGIPTRVFDLGTNPDGSRRRFTARPGTSKVLEDPGLIEAVRAYVQRRKLQADYWFDPPDRPRRPADAPVVPSPQDPPQPEPSPAKPPRR